MRIQSSHSWECRCVIPAVIAKAVMFLLIKGNVTIAIMNAGPNAKMSTIGITPMVRTSNRKNAGTRRNKRLHTHTTTLKETRGSWLLSDLHQQIANSNPNHEARFVDMTECFPLAGQRNLKKWKA